AVSRQFPLLVTGGVTGGVPGAGVEGKTGGAGGFAGVAAGSFSTLSSGRLSSHALSSAFQPPLAIRSSIICALFIVEVPLMVEQVQFPTNSPSFVRYSVTQRTASGLLPRDTDPSLLTE